jgi:hypothetical protein
MRTVSRGFGRIERRVIEALEKSPDRRASRMKLEEVLVGSEGFDQSNLLRAVKSLARRRCVIFEDAHRKEHSFVQLLPKREPISESWIFEVLAQIGDR